MTPVPWLVRPRFATDAEAARRVRRDPAFRCTPVPPLPDYEAIVTQAMREFWDSGAWVN